MEFTGHEGRDLPPASCFLTTFAMEVNGDPGADDSELTRKDVGAVPGEVLGGWAERNAVEEMELFAVAAF